MEKKRNSSSFGTFIVSLDFELFWGVLDHKTFDEYGTNVLGGRAAIPALLELFKKHGINATWATVGFMFAESKAEAESFSPPDDKKPTYKNNALSPYPSMDKTDGNENLFFAPEIIKQISACDGQEIGSHTFSHFYCREEGQTPEQFRLDMESAIKIARDKGYDLKSVVLPRNQCTPECIEILKELGFLCYRDEENDWIHEKVKLRPLMRLLRLADVYLPLTGKGGYHPKNENGIWNLVGSRMYKPINKLLMPFEGLKVHRIKRQMKHAAKKGMTFHLWWHPHNIGVQTEKHLRQLSEIFEYYDRMKAEYGMRSLNMGQAAAENKG